MLKRLSCWLRGHPYPWVLSPEDLEYERSVPHIAAQFPPREHCSNCGCTSR